MSTNVNAHIKLIRNKLQSGKVILFAGAGWSLESNLPSGWTLAQKLADSIGYTAEYYDTLGSIAEHYQYFHSRVQLVEFLVSELYTGRTPAQSHNEAVNHNWKAIYTTNYDTLIEQAYNLAHKKYQKIVYDSQLLTNSQYVPIIKIHGCLSADFRLSTSVPIVITDQDYEAFGYERIGLINKLRQSMLEGAILLFIGYGLADRFWWDLRLDLQKTLGENLPNSYSVIPNFSPNHRQYWQRRKVILLKYTANEFFQLI